MKIGVITQPLKNNYGGLLQAYALQETLKRLDHDAIVLDRHDKKVTLEWKAWLFVKYFLRCLVGRRKRVFYPTDAQEKFVSQNTSVFIQEHIVKTEILYSTEALSRVVEKGHFDALIVGSDQVWRPLYSNIENCFLDFVENEKDVIRIAYAASFGVDHWEFMPKLTKRSSELVQKFDAVCVREDSGVELCNKYLGVAVQHVLDPTMLLDPGDYCALVCEKNESESAGDLMTYILDASSEKKAMVQHVESVLGLKSFSVMQRQKLTYETQHNIQECVFPRVTKWLRGFMDAKFVIVDSFHGCVFALLFNVPFVAIGNKRRGMARFESLLRQFNLIERLIFSPDDLIDELIWKPIDWEQINNTRAKLKADSQRFLVENLG